MSKYINAFAKSYTPNWSEEVFVIKEVKNTESGHIFSVILTGRKLLECITKINCKKQIEKTLELKK